MKLLNAKGVRDFSPEDKMIRQEIVGILKETFEQHGFNPLETPLLERFNILASKYAGGDEILKEIFTLTDQGDRKLALRYDLTVPFARYIGMNPDVKMPFKRYQIGRVYRDGPIKKGRYREFYQCDVDVVGTKDMAADAELLSIAADVFEKIGIDVVIKLNSRKILDGMMEVAGVPKKKWVDTILTIDKLEKQGEVAVRKELIQKGLKTDSIDKLFGLIVKGKNNAETLANLKKELKEGIGKKGLEEIENLLKYSKNMGTDLDLDPSLARGLAYYTGPVFEVFLKDSNITSAIAAGGRYDNMIQEFLDSKEEYPAVGISFGLELINDVLNETQGERKKSVVKVFVIPIKTKDESMKITRKLRDAGIKTDMDLMDRSISKNLDFANKYNIPYVLFVGPKELEQGKLKLKDMKSGEEEMFSVEKVIKKLR